MENGICTCEKMHYCNGVQYLPRHQFSIFEFVLKEEETKQKSFQKKK